MPFWPRSTINRDPQNCHQPYSPLLPTNQPHDGQHFDRGKDEFRFPVNGGCGEIEKDDHDETDGDPHGVVDTGG
jgi:hypothetical protein